MIRSFFRLVQNFLGWSVLDTCPKENCVILYNHTSYWDGLILFLYHREANFIALAKPQLFNGWTRRILYNFGVIPTARLEDRGSNTVATILEIVQLVKEIPGRPKMIVMSPKGTIYKKEWRSGYKYLADGLNWPIKVALIDYHARKITVMSPNQDEDELKKTLGYAVPKNPENSEIPIHISYDAFELICFCDIVTISNLAMLPAVWALRPHPFMFLLSAATFIVSWAYHASKETKFRQCDSVLSVTLITTACIYFFKKLNSNIFGCLLVSYFFYLSGTARTEGPRRTYIIWHTLFHLSISYTAYKLVT
jgi:hypothetical protein